MRIETPAGDPSQVASPLSTLQRLLFEHYEPSRNCGELLADIAMDRRDVLVGDDSRPARNLVDRRFPGLQGVFPSLLSLHRPLNSLFLQF